MEIRSQPPAAVPATLLASIQGLEPLMRELPAGSDLAQKAARETIAVRLLLEQRRYGEASYRLRALTARLKEARRTAGGSRSEGMRTVD